MDLNCRRCQKPITYDGMQVTRQIPPPDGRRCYFSGEAFATVSMYHKKCLPPNLFHKLAGSLPVGQSPTDTSLRKEHAVSGGLSSPKPRKRPSRRTRYKRTEARRQKESAEREQRQHEATMKLTINDVLERGGKPGLCHCGIFSSSGGYFITPNGYCRYCGKWTPEVFILACGEQAARDAIGELELYKRAEMLRLAGLK